MTEAKVPSYLDFQEKIEPKANIKFDVDSDLITANILKNIQINNIY